MVVSPGKVVILGGRRSVRLTPGKELKSVSEVQQPTRVVKSAGIEPLERRVETAFLLRMEERTVALRHLERTLLIAGKSVPLTLRIKAPRDARPGSNFFLRVEQLVRCEVTGCYTVVITIV